MNFDIKKRIDAINNPTSIQLFFSLLKKLIIQNAISKDDERLAINVRNDYRKRFSVNINSRLILYIKDGNEFGLMINNSLLENIDSIPTLSKENFEKQTPSASLISFSFETLQENKELIERLWLNSCSQYLPAQTKSQYRNHHIDELYNIATDDIILNDYLTPAADKIMNFAEMIKELRVYLKNEDHQLFDFEIFPIKNSSRWVWIGDHLGIINDTKAHYEIIKRKDKIYLEIHFEGTQKEKDIYSNNISKLSEKAKWFKWNKSKSIRYNETFNLVDTNILEKLVKGLLYLEENLGSTIRSIKKEFQGNSISILIANITWNSNDWKTVSEDPSGHPWVGGENIPHESWNFDFENSRNTDGKIYGFAKFTNSPKVEGNQNLIIFYSQGKIVGFYGKASILKEWVTINDKESYNLIGDKYLSTVLENKIDHIKEKGFLENKERLGQIGFSYLENKETAINIIDEAIKLNPNQSEILENIKKWLDQSNSDQNNSNNLMKLKIESIPLNQILYGPPGTGKTYNTINKSLEILGEVVTGKSREELKNLFDLKVNEGQIVFTTFHQSMSYEDFIEGIKPKSKEGKVEYHIEDGIFKKVSKKALAQYLNIDKQDDKDDFDTLYNDYLEKLKPEIGLRKGTFTTKTGIEIMLVDTSENSILVKYLWTNNKKESEGIHVFSITKDKLKKVLLEGIDPKTIKNLKSEIHPIVGHIHCELFAVYKDFYDFILKNKGEIEAVHFNYEEADFEDVLEEFQKLTKEEVNSKSIKPFVLIIDEINRGNVSQVFGELITLIEDDKRIGRNEAITIDLPYSKKKFGVPSNLYIIGTMNTADRSVEALDTALRRRFSFEEMLPNTDYITPSAMYCRLLWKYKHVGWKDEEFKEKENALFGLLGVSDDLKEKKIEIWKKMLSDNQIMNLSYFNEYTFEGIDLSLLLKKINKRIEYLIGRDHTIGHSYFISVNSINDLKEVFKNKIIPLLQEYFFGDYGKIGLVLGKDFFEPIDDDQNENLFSEFYDYDGNDFAQKQLYILKDISLFKDDQMKIAIKNLLK